MLGHKAMESEAVRTVAVRLVGAALGAGDDPASQVVLGDALQLLTAILAVSSQLTADLQVWHCDCLILSASAYKLKGRGRPAGQVVLGDALQLLPGSLAASSQLTTDLQMRCWALVS